MLASVKGYYDGTAIHALDTMQAKKNQKLIITILDDFIDEAHTEKASKSTRGMLSSYANPELIKQERTAWENTVVEKTRS